MSTEKTTLSGRLREARLAAHFSQQDIADRLNITVQSVSQWETGKTSPGLDRLTLLSDLYHVNWNWLTKGEGAKEEKTEFVITEYELYRNRLAPTIDFGSLTSYGQWGLEMPPWEISDDVVLTQRERVGNLFAITINDESNDPIYRAGDLIVGDTGIKAVPGDMVFVRMRDHPEPLFRQIKAFRRMESGDLVADLKPHNPDFPTEAISLENEYDRILGVMVEHRRFRRPSSGQSSRA